MCIRDRVRIAGKPKEKCKDVSPGPIYYPPLKPSSSATFMYSMRKKLKESNKSDIPGPGHYDLDTLRPSRSAISFGHKKGKSLRNLLDSPIPGPGAFDIPVVPIRERTGPKYSFGKSPQIKSAVSTTPGPGAYDTKSFIGTEGIKPSISSHVTESASTKSLVLPGPGTYDPPLSKHRAPAYKLGTEERAKKQSTKKNKEEEVPGPGSYEPNYKVGKSNLPKWK
eukprot:TRINITY_DN3121_c0_g1_i33.p1 TRINITY_DN3121_c0_g1~~TRINITY_DN3121_c0_g1_i33.p1  ORF type:complete len:223 (-),score=30.16 TRINITY_DN3121_c0_g1_i33:237-905(-)